MTKSEMRSCRREYINDRLHYWHDWARFYNYSYGKLTFCKNTVRSLERANYGMELKAYANQ